MDECKPLATGRTAPQHDIRITEDLVGAAETLGLRGLSDACNARLGAHEVGRCRLKR